MSNSSLQKGLQGFSATRKSELQPPEPQPRASSRPPLPLSLRVINIVAKSNVVNRDKSFHNEERVGPFFTRVLKSALHKQLIVQTPCSDSLSRKTPHTNSSFLSERAILLNKP